MKPPLTIVTGASSNHFLPLQSLLWTISQFEPAARVIAWDLGLTPDEHASLLHAPFAPANFELRIFDFTKYPAHFDINVEAGRMAFRPTVLAQMSHELLSLNSQPSTLVCWLDAGCQLREGLDSIRACTATDGIYCPCAPGNIGACLHPSSRVPLVVAEDLLQKPIRDAGICCFDIGKLEVMTLLDRWAAVALDKNCTAPEGSTRRTHRQDAVFAVLLNQATQTNHWCLEGKRLRGLAIKQDNVTLAETKFRVGSLRTPMSRRPEHGPMQTPIRAT